MVAMISSARLGRTGRSTSCGRAIYHEATDFTTPRHKTERPVGAKLQLQVSRTHRILNLAGVTLPFAGLIAAIVVLWGTDLVDWTDLAIRGVLYALTALGVTLGFHRLLTHRAFATHKGTEYALAILGS